MSDDDLEKRLRKANICQVIAGSADTIATYINVKTFGADYEGNPFVVDMMDDFGDLGGLAIPKVGVMACVYVLSNWSKKKLLPYAATAVWGAGAMANVLMYCSQ